MCRYGTRASAPTGASVAPTSSSTRSRTPTPVRGSKILQQYRRPFAMPRTGATKNNTRHYRASQSDCAGIRPQGQMLSRTAAPQGAEKRSRGSARGRQRPHQHTLIPPHAVSGIRSRCCSRISSASSNSIACDCAARRGAKDEFLLAAIAQNLRKLAKMAGPPL
jgi:hypothetical protein